MKYLIGIDGGGTKTAFILCDQDGKKLAHLVGEGTSYSQYGINAVVNTIECYINQCISEAKIDAADVVGICAALPCIGEYEQADKEFIRILTQRLSKFPIKVINDAVVGWAGSLAGCAGINIVAGTGSIAYGANSKGECARCGGWSWKFSDEGSCYWAGQRVMQLFSKQADGRLPKSALYYNLYKKFNLKTDFQFIEIVEKDYCPYREKVASLQIELNIAANDGDESAIEVYNEAARELAAIVCSIAQKLDFALPINLSYSGGIFKAGKLILEPFSKLLPAERFTLCTPILSPVQGAVLMAFREFFPEKEHQAIENMKAEI
ncbi:MAG: BadF/BadG/BcrA/BcrD ATPase family protein [Oscillospiraceae bacterium]